MNEVNKWSWNMFFHHFSFLLLCPSHWSPPTLSHSPALSLPLTKRIYPEEGAGEMRQGCQEEDWKNIHLPRGHPRFLLLGDLAALPSSMYETALIFLPTLLVLRYESGLSGRWSLPCLLKGKWDSEDLEVMIREKNTLKMTHIWSSSLPFHERTQKRTC